MLSVYHQIVDCTIFWAYVFHLPSSPSFFLQANCITSRKIPECKLPKPKLPVATPYWATQQEGWMEQGASVSWLCEQCKLHSVNSKGGPRLNACGAVPLRAWGGWIGSWIQRRKCHIQLCMGKHPNLQENGYSLPHLSPWFPDATFGLRYVPRIVQLQFRTVREKVKYGFDQCLETLSSLVIWNV